MEREIIGGGLFLRNGLNGRTRAGALKLTGRF